MIVTLLEELGGFTLFIRRILQSIFSRSVDLSETLVQIWKVCVASFPTVLLSGIFVGAILIIQFQVMLAQYDAEYLMGGLSSSAIFREVGPLIIAFLLAGKIGAYTAAELGTMRVTEQIDAIQTLNTDPFGYLITPRFIAIVFSSITLLFLGLVVSLLGAMGVASVFYGINSLEYLSTMPRFVSFGTVAAGLFKSTVYAFIVAGVSCFKGATTTGGARGVGIAVTETAVYTNLYIVIANFVTSHIIQVVEASL